jgi:hypothetical protein
MATGVSGGELDFENWLTRNFSTKSLGYFENRSGEVLMRWLSVSSPEKL